MTTTIGSTLRQDVPPEIQIRLLVSGTSIEPSCGCGQAAVKPASIPSSSDQRSGMSGTSHLLAADAFVCVVQLVGDDVSVSGQGFFPAQGHRGGRVGHSLQVRGRARHLDWKKHRKNKKMKIGAAKQPNIRAQLHPSVPNQTHPPRPAWAGSHLEFPGIQPECFRLSRTATVLSSSQLAVESLQSVQS